MPTIDHRAGQYRAELFDDFVSLILAETFPETLMRRYFLVPKAWNTNVLEVDFFLKTRDGHSILVETKAPYSLNTTALNHTLQLLTHVAATWPRSISISRIILAYANSISEAYRLQIDRTTQNLKQYGIIFEFWDVAKIKDLSFKYFHVQPKSFSAQDLESVLTIMRETHAQRLEAHIPNQKKLAQHEQVPKEGEFQNTVIVMADFCSYSKFVGASGDDKDLITSVMGRFYRETRRVIEEAGGIIDKYMGDGILAFWLSPNTAQEFGRRLEECMRRLVGVAINIAESWQEQIDASVLPIGMRIGATRGKVLFISESPGGEPPFHAIGDSINLAARLQSAADPNTLVISNKLKTAYFESNDEYQKVPAINAKNIGEVVAWRKDLTTYSEIDSTIKHATGL